MTRLRWRRWWIHYEVPEVPRVVEARCGPFLFRSTAEHARRSIWRDKPEPPGLLIVQER